MSPKLSYTWRMKGSGDGTETEDGSPPSANGSAHGANNLAGLNGSVRGGKPPLGSNRGGWPASLRLKPAWWLVSWQLWQRNQHGGVFVQQPAERQTLWTPADLVASTRATGSRAP